MMKGWLTIVLLLLGREMACDPKLLEIVLGCMLQYNLPVEMKVSMVVVVTDILVGGAHERQLQRRYNYSSTV